jgi:hypothetical protein
MGDMSLNIKNERTHALVRELATLTGMSQTDAVTDAVERRLAELTRETEAERQARVDEIMRLVSLIAPGFKRPGATAIRPRISTTTWDSLGDRRLLGDRRGRAR